MLNTAMCAKLVLMKINATVSLFRVFVTSDVIKGLRFICTRNHVTGFVVRALHTKMNE